LISQAPTIPARLVGVVDKEGTPKRSLKRSPKFLKHVFLSVTHFQEGDKDNKNSIFRTLHDFEAHRKFKSGIVCFILGSWRRFRRIG
jgi:hypothetical protein